jgi:formylglycine-generating enzyme required for sulfatase activity
MRLDTLRRFWPSLVCVLTVWSAARSADDPAAKNDSDRRFAGTQAGQSMADNVLRTQMVWIPPGKFLMGSPASEPGHRANEGQAEVTLAAGFWLAKYEVTQSEWENVMHTTPWRGQKGVLEGDNYPASFISWHDAMKFCELMTQYEHEAGRLPAGWKYSLPSETQWEYACRAGTATAFSFGDDAAPLNDYGWYDGNTVRRGERFAHSIGQKQPNAWGLCDMHGNVYEWCLDAAPQSSSGTSGEKGGSSSAASRRADRGGGWEDPAGKARSPSRDFNPPDERNAHLGFRLAIVPTGK